MKEVSSTIFRVFGMTRSGIEPRSPGPLANTLPARSTKEITGIFLKLKFSMQAINNLLNFFD